MNQDGEDEALLSALEYDAIEVKFLLLEPQDYVSIYGVLGAGEDSPKNNVDMDDYVSSRSGVRNFNNAQEGEDNIVNKETLHTRPNEAEVGNFQVHNDLSSTCEDYLLDVEYNEVSSDVESSSSKESQGLIRKSQFPVFGSRKTDSLEMSGPSGAILRVGSCQNNIFSATNSDAHGISSQDYGCETSYYDNKWSKSPNSFTMHTFDNMDDVSNLVTRHMCSDKDDTDMFFYPRGTLDATIKEYHDVASTGQRAEIESQFKEYTLSSSDLLLPTTSSSELLLPTTKRPRRPTRRYVEESAETVSTSNKKRRAPSSASKDKIVRDKWKDNPARQGTIKLFTEELCAEPIQVPFGPIQVPFGPVISRECSKSHASAAVKVPEVKTHASTAVKVPEVKTHASTAVRVPEVKSHASTAVKVPEVHDSDDESTMDEGEGKIRIYKARPKEDHAPRKHHKLWTIAEVKKLIDGVAQYGVGKWSDIKNQFFTSSPHRTSVDLKDKWRNLLKASRLQTGASDNKRNPSWRPLPKPILNRVIELSAIYPYPRILKSKVSHVQRNISSPIPNNGNTDALPNDSGNEMSIRNLVTETSLGNDFACSA